MQVDIFEQQCNLQGNLEMRQGGTIQKGDGTLVGRIYPCIVFDQKLLKGVL